jgi:signal transduction histidine kinase
MQARNLLHGWVFNARTGFHESLARYGMTPDQLYNDYQDYQSYIGWTEADADHVRAAASVLQPHLPLLVDDFYAEIGRHGETRKVIEGGQTSIQRLKGTLLQWLQELLQGPYDRDYVARRWKVGARHIDVGLEHVYVSTALARLRAGLVQILNRYWQGEREGLVPAILSVNKLLDLDLTLIDHAYQTEYRTRIRKNQHLAKVGHVAGSVGHALREPLNVLSTSAYYLRRGPDTNPEKAEEHYQRIERNIEVTEQILLELSDFARMRAPELHPLMVRDCVNEALEQVPLPEGIEVHRSFPPSLPPALGDKDQIRQVFVHLIRRARTSMQDGGRLSIVARHTTETVGVAVEDTGNSVSQEMLAAVQAPLSWSTVRILGMNLAVARAILEWNGDSLHAENSQDGSGCTMTVRLRTAVQVGSVVADTTTCPQHQTVSANR